MHMKTKKKYARIPAHTALSIVRSYHLTDVSQPELARRHGVSVGYVSRLCSGLARPEIFAQVAAEDAADFEAAQ